VTSVTFSVGRDWSIYCAGYGGLAVFGGAQRRRIYKFFTCLGGRVFIRIPHIAVELFRATAHRILLRTEVVDYAE
jgi:hypothetical protein